MPGFDEWSKQKGLLFETERPKGILDVEPTAEPSPKLGIAEGMGKSALWAIPQLVGMEPPKEVREFAAESPWLALGAELPAFMIPYLGWSRLATLPRIASGVGKVSPKAGEAIQKLSTAERLAEAPIKTGAARMVVQFAPFEAARVVTAATAGEGLAEALGTEYRGTGEVALQAGADLLLGGALGGLFEGLRAAGQRDVLKRPAQIELRKMQEQAAEVPEEGKALFEARMNKLRAQVRGEVITKGRYVGDLGEGRLTKGINRLFKPKVTEGLERKILNRGASQTYFKDRAEADAIMERAGVLGKEPWMQTPRYIKVTEKGNPRLIDGTLTKALDSVDSELGWFMQQERGTGMFVMGRKLQKGEWVVFKTDSPGQFVPEHAQWGKMISGKGAVFGPVGAPVRALSDQSGAATEVYDNVARFKKDVPVFDYRDLDVRKGRSAEFAEKILERTGLGKAKDSELAARAGGFIRNTLAPAMFQFTHSPTAGHVFSAAKVARDSAEALAE